MPENDLALLTDAARLAGDIARRFWQRSPATWEKSDGSGPVTEADLEIDRMLKAELGQARADYGWLSEETEDGTERLQKPRVFIVDPIDGTRAFIQGARTFAHSLAVAENRQVTAAVVYLPMLDRLYTATRDGEARLNGSVIKCSSRTRIDGATVLASSPNFTPAHWPGGMPPVSRQFRSSLAYRLCLVAEGRFDAMLTFRDTWEWDVAAGALIAAKAGAKVSDRHGKTPAFNNPTPTLSGMIAAGTAMHAALTARF